MASEVVGFTADTDQKMMDTGVTDITNTHPTTPEAATFAWRCSALFHKNTVIGTIKSFTA